MKIKGNMKKATIFTPELFPPPTPENFAKYLSGAVATTTAPAPAAGGLISERIFDLMAAYLD